MRVATREPWPAVTVFDFFSGCGGTSAGLQAAGMSIALGIDNDLDAGRTFCLNFPQARFLQRDLQAIPVGAIAEPVAAARRHGHTLFCACAPCQPFSRQNIANRGRTKAQYLLLDFLRFVGAHDPDVVLVENVPGLQDLDEKRHPFGPFVRGLRARGYDVIHEILDCRQHGVPQRRRRLFVIASRHGPVCLPPATHGSGLKPFTTVRDWIADLPPIQAGKADASVPNHRAMALSPLNLQRIRATPEGGDRRHWPEHLLLRCHRKADAGYTDVYGRLRWDEPATGLTTKCISLSNGRFGHPDQDRALSVREAASLQTFPRNFLFTGSLPAMARQIGNAVPVLLAEQLGRALLEHLDLAAT